MTWLSLRHSAAGRPLELMEGPLPNQSHTHKHILLVDPDEAFSQVLQNVLGTNYGLERAPDINRAVSLLDDKGLDAILLNLDLQNGSGDPCALLKAVSERESAPPVIAFGWD